MASLPVICTYCNQAVYDYSGPPGKVAFKAEYFSPRRDFAPPQGDSELICPNCGQRWVAVSLQIDSIRMVIDPATRGSGTVKY